MTRWTGAELRASREALGLSVNGLAAALTNPVTGQPWKQSRVSECERDVRLVPEWLPEQVTALERARDQLTASMLSHLAGAPGAVLIVHETDADYRAAHPTDPPIPAAVHRVAAALAAARVEAETGERPRVMYSG